MIEQQALLAAYLVQVVGGLLLALLLAWFHRTYGHSYLREWSWAWAALAVYVFGGLLAVVVFAREYPPQNVWRLLLASTTMVAGYTHLAWLMTGTYAVTRRDAISRRAKTALLALCVIVGVGSALTFTSDPALGSARFFARVGVRSGVASVAYVTAAVWLARRGGWRSGAGRAVVVGAFLLYGIEQLNYFVNNLIELLGIAPMSASFSLFGFLDFLLQFAMGLGMVVWLLEEERNELARTADALRRSEEKLRQSQRLEAVGQLAGGVAHDFNNLLTVISGRVQRLLGRLEPGSEESQEAAQIDEASQRGAELVQQLLAFSRRQVLAPRHVDVNETVLAVLRMLNRALGDHVRLETELAEDLGWVLVDPIQMEQVLVNLALNARDAMPDGGTLTIRTRAVDIPIDDADSLTGVVPGQHIELSVHDTGVGMDEETRRHIFEPFFTTKGVGKGSGLGLATVYGVVRQSHGSVSVDSAPGEGTIVTVMLPRADAPTTAMEPAEPAAEAETLAGAGTILIVEDEARIRDLLIEVLGDQGYDVLVASNGAEALDLVEDGGGDVDLLLTDVAMPKMGGPELADALEARCPGLKVVFMSGYSEAVVASRLASEHRVLLEKPFSLPTLLEQVRSAMAHG